MRVETRKYIAEFDAQSPSRDAFLIMRSLYSLLQQMHKIFIKLLDVHGVSLTAEEWSTLVSLNRHNGKKVNQVALACFLLKDKTTITRYLNSLEKKQCITRIRDEKDRRNSVISITDYGKDILQKSSKINEELFNVVLNGINAEERESLKRILTIIGENVNV